MGREQWWAGKGQAWGVGFVVALCLQVRGFYIPIWQVVRVRCFLRVLARKCSLPLEKCFAVYFRSMYLFVDKPKCELKCKLRGGMFFIHFLSCHSVPLAALASFGVVWAPALPKFCGAWSVAVWAVPVVCSGQASASPGVQGMRLLHSQRLSWNDIPGKDGKGNVMVKNTWHCLGFQI